MQVRREVWGEVVARAACGLPWATVLGDLDQAAFPMLGALDPYGDAVFNHRQVPALLRELDLRPPNAAAHGLLRFAPCATWCHEDCTTICCLPVISQRRSERTSGSEPGSPRVLRPALLASPCLSQRMGTIGRTVAHQLADECRASLDGGHGGATRCVCENFLYGFKAAPRGRSRRRLGRRGRAPAAAPARPASGARSAGAKGKDGAAETRGSHGAAADLTRGPLAAAPSGLCGRPGRPPDRGQAYSRRPRVKSAAP